MRACGRTLIGARTDCSLGNGAATLSFNLVDHSGTSFATALVIAVGCSFVVARDGMPERIPQSAYGISSFSFMWSYEGCTVRPTKADCETGLLWDKAKHRIVLIGESNAVHYHTPRFLLLVRFTCLYRIQD